MNVAELVAARDRLIAAASEESVETVLRELLASLHVVARFNRAALMLTDTDSLLPFGGIVEEIGSEDCVPFWDNELLDPDFVKFNVLAQSPDPVATLSEATDGDLERSPRFQKLLRRFGAGDELRVAFRHGERSWAVASLIRPAEFGQFTPDEVCAVRELVPVAARAVRAAVIRRDAAQAGISPAMLVVSSDGSIESTTPEADHILEELSTSGLDIPVPTSILAAARRAKNSRTKTSVTLRARGSSGRWFRVHAAPLGDDGRVAVVVELAPTSDLVPILLERYGLTPRETEVVPLLARGLSTKQIAAEMSISRHTVGDYIKLIFEKCEATSRGELVAKLFTEHLFDGHKSATAYF